MADSEKLIKIVLLGYKKTGKTKFCEYIDGKNNEINFSEYIETNGASYFSKSIIYNNNLYNIDIWDTSGQEKYESLTKFFFRNASIVFIFFNYNNKKSFTKAKYLLNSVKEYTDMSDVIYVLIGNKYHEEINPDDDNEMVNEEEVLEFIEQNNLIFGHLSISEKYSNGVNELFKKVVREYSKKISKINSEF